MLEKHSKKGVFKSTKKERKLITLIDRINGPSCFLFIKIELKVGYPSECSFPVVNGNGNPLQ